MRYYAGIGSRETPEDVCAEMRAIAGRLRELGWTLRSGGAVGADSAFEAGAGDQKEIYVPWYGFNGSTSRLLPTDEAYGVAKKFHPAWDRLGTGARALMARNSHQILGKDLKSPAELVVCWTKDGKPSGGTGQALRIAESLGIPVINLRLSRRTTSLSGWAGYKSLDLSIRKEIEERLGGDGEG